MSIVYYEDIIMHCSVLINITEELPDAYDRLNNMLRTNIELFNETVDIIRNGISDKKFSDTIYAVKSWAPKKFKMIQSPYLYNNDRPFTLRRMSRIKCKLCNNNTSYSSNSYCVECFNYNIEFYNSTQKYLDYRLLLNSLGNLPTEIINGNIIEFITGHLPKEYKNYIEEIISKKTTKKTLL
jgi:hypothetical protein